MTTQDKTGDKLVETIRRTKAGTTKTGDEAAAAPRRRPTSKGSETLIQLPAVTRRTAARDTYESSGRIWPD